MNRRCLVLILLVLAAAVVAFVLGAVGMFDVHIMTAIGLALVALALFLKALCCECKPRQPGTVGQTSH